VKLGQLSEFRESADEGHPMKAGVMRLRSERCEHSRFGFRRVEICA